MKGATTTAPVSDSRHIHEDIDIGDDIDGARRQFGGSTMKLAQQLCIFFTP
jgi:hypothetical protein